eukprot:7084527-Alexandrium_andersonii.AAC.2
MVLGRAGVARKLVAPSRGPYLTSWHRRLPSHTKARCDQPREHHQVPTYLFLMSLSSLSSSSSSSL